MKKTLKQMMMFWLVCTAVLPSLASELKTATFAGGCFWCMEKPFDLTPGVVKTVSGYMGGHIQFPSYKDVSGGGSGHIEVVQITYDPKQVSFSQLLEVFWKNIDPLDPNGQFCDKGSQYQSAIFVSNQNERTQSVLSLSKEAKWYHPKKISTSILDSSTFYPAESYHQDYYIKNPKRYSYYRYRCQRDNRLKSLSDLRHQKKSQLMMKK